MRYSVTQYLNFCLSVVIVVLCSSQLAAQSAEQKYVLQLYGSAISYKGEVQHQFWPNKKFSDTYLDQELNWGAGVGLSYYISPSFDGALHLTYNRLKASNPTESFEANMGSAMAGVRLKMYGTVLKEDALIGPYLAVYGGGVYANSDGHAIPEALKPVTPFNEKFLSLAGMTGAGIRVLLADNLTVFLESTWMVTESDKIDGKDQGNWEQFLRHSIGLGFRLPKNTRLPSNYKE